MHVEGQMRANCHPLKETRLERIAEMAITNQTKYRGNNRALIKSTKLLVIREKKKLNDDQCILFPYQMDQDDS